MTDLKQMTETFQKSFTQEQTRILDWQIQQAELLRGQVDATMKAGRDAMKLNQELLQATTAAWMAAFQVPGAPSAEA
ncbi:MAG: hypothetical protein VX899_10255 [Myxococcota bacterium]|nr:hypothetical protein [Myxococcota bacterium]